MGAIEEKYKNQSSFERGIYEKIIDWIISPELIFSFCWKNQYDC